MIEKKRTTAEWAQAEARVKARRKELAMVVTITEHDLFTLRQLGSYIRTIQLPLFPLPIPVRKVVEEGRVK